MGWHLNVATCILRNSQTSKELGCAAHFPYEYRPMLSYEPYDVQHDNRQRIGPCVKRKYTAQPISNVPASKGGVAWQAKCRHNCQTVQTVRWALFVGLSLRSCSKKCSNVCFKSCCGAFALNWLSKHTLHSEPRNDTVVFYRVFETFFCLKWASACYCCLLSRVVWLTHRDEIDSTRRYWDGQTALIAWQKLDLPFAGCCLSGIDALMGSVGPLTQMVVSTVVPVQVRSSNLAFSFPSSRVSF